VTFHGRRVELGHVELVDLADARLLHAASTAGCTGHPGCVELDVEIAVEKRDATFLLCDDQTRVTFDSSTGDRYVSQGDAAWCYLLFFELEATLVDPLDGFDHLEIS
jgi:hypothetical protein